MLKLLLLIFLIVILVGALPGTPWMSGYGFGYYPSGGALIIIILIILLL
jgi:hypothetical protein